MLSAIQSQVDSRDKTGGGSGTGQGQGHGSAVGIQASYADTIKAIVQSAWSYSGRADRASLSAVVLLQLDSNGKILGYQIIRSSGDPTFDGTLKTAIAKSENKLPAPPNASMQNLEITFYDQ